MRGVHASDLDISKFKAMGETNRTSAQHGLASIPDPCILSLLLDLQRRQDTYLASDRFFFIVW
jgi:hypothetical protein